MAAVAAVSPVSDDPWRIAAHRVDLGRDRLEVFGVGTGPVLAQVVDRQALGDGTLVQLVGDAVGVVLPLPADPASGRSRRRSSCRSRPSNPRSSIWIFLMRARRRLESETLPKAWSSETSP